MVNLRLAETQTGILKFKYETKKCSDLIEKHINYVTNSHKI